VDTAEHHARGRGHSVGEQVLDPRDELGHSREAIGQGAEALGLVRRLLSLLFLSLFYGCFCLCVMPPN
jgi:hypothetical protein